MSSDITQLFQERIFFDRLRDQIYFIIFLLIALVIFVQFITSFTIFSLSLLDVVGIGLFVLFAIGFQLFINYLFDRYKRYRMLSQFKDIQTLEELRYNIELVIDQKFYPNKSSGILETFDKKVKLLENLKEFADGEFHPVIKVEKDGAFFYRFTSSIGNYVRIEQNVIKPLLRFLDIDVGVIADATGTDQLHDLVLGIKGFYLVVTSGDDDDQEGHSLLD